jgi:TRAP transporter TAXI family solute receptor
MTYWARMIVLTAVTAALTCGCGGSSGNQGGGAGDADSGKPRFAAIGTGGVSGVYYPTGGNIAKLVNEKKATYNITCTAESTGGSVANVNSLLNGDFEFGVVQSDIQYQAYNGKGGWAEKGPQKTLRAVFSIHSELLTLVAADDAEISSLADLRGKRVNIGNPGSGQRLNATDALAAAGLDPAEDVIAESVKAAEAPGMLQDGRLDAFFYTVGHPSGAIKEATAGTRSVHFVPITGIDELLSKTPYYARGSVPVAEYPKATSKSDVPTFGVKATLMTTANVPDDMVYAVTKEVFENFDSFRVLHAAYKGLTREQMLEGLSAPLHDGAKKYFVEAGLIAANPAATPPVEPAPAP